MARSMALLKREVVFSHDEAVSGGESIHYPWLGSEEPRCFQDMADAGFQDMADAVTEYMRTFKAHAVLEDPPRLSSIDILQPPESVPLQPPCHKLHSGRISSADKNLVALYAGAYRPGSRSMAMGGYLIYDARKNSLSPISRLPDDNRHVAVGVMTAVVMCNGEDGRYLLAELVRLTPRFSEAAIWLWKSSAPGSGWAMHPVRMPLPRTFCTHLCFSYRGSTLCWVDLLGGMVVCDLGNDNPNLELRFIPLPSDCQSYNIRCPWSGDDTPKIYRYLSVQEFRSMACVGNTIKLVCVDGNVFQVPGKSFELIVYKLSRDLSEWTIDKKYDVGNIWASKAYQSTGMPNLAPSFPVLSINEDGVIYLVFTPLWVLDETPDCPLHAPGYHCRLRVEHKTQYLARVDIKNNNVQLYPQSTESRIHSQLLATEIIAYQQRLQDHPREIEATELGASGKRIRL